LALIASATLPHEASWLVALAAVIVLGVPHGALDGAVAAPLLRPRYGRTWFGMFAVPYLGLSALVLLVWQVAPMTTLANFLAVSVLHFGEEDAGPGRPFEILVRGGAPIALPALLRPEETAEVFAVVARVSMPLLPEWWTVAAWLWLTLAVAWLLRQPRRREVLIEILILAAAFRLLPPLTAFALYFVGLHAPPPHERPDPRPGSSSRHRHDGASCRCCAAGEKAMHDMAALIRGADARQLGQTFRLVFLAACVGILVAFVCLSLVEERPLQDAGEHKRSW
jgi:Brp/Blh family beta-carotene 15,15'-monooxygenase